MNHADGPVQDDIGRHVNNGYIGPKSGVQGGKGLVFPESITAQVLLKQLGRQVKGPFQAGESDSRWQIIVAGELLGQAATHKNQVRVAIKQQWGDGIECHLAFHRLGKLGGNQRRHIGVPPLFPAGSGKAQLYEAADRRLPLLSHPVGRRKEIFLLQELEPIAVSRPGVPLAFGSELGHGPTAALAVTPGCPPWSQP